MPDKNDPANTQADADANQGSSGGEDDSSTEKNGDDSHLHDDQKSRPMKT